MTDPADLAAPGPTPDLIAHILERYHATHRRELPELVALARRVERVHGTDPNAPHGLAAALESLTAELEAHMRAEEEAVLYPALAAGEGARRAGTIASLRHDHAAQERDLARIAAITHGFRLPRGACRSWTRLYDGVGKLAEDLDEHRHLEERVLFPRLERTARRPTHRKKESPQ